MAEILINGKVYTIYENLPTVEIPPYESAYPKGEKKRNQENRKNMARYNYRKKK